MHRHDRHTNKHVLSLSPVAHTAVCRQARMRGSPHCVTLDLSSRWARWPLAPVCASLESLSRHAPIKGSRPCIAGSQQLLALDITMHEYYYYECTLTAIADGDDSEHMCGMQAAGRLLQDTGCPRAAGRALPLLPAPLPAVGRPLHWA